MARKTHDRSNDRIMWDNRITFEDNSVEGGLWCECARIQNSIVIRGYKGPFLTPRQARDVARWLNETADQIERDIKAGKA
jgi:hypothetical protein